MSTFTKNSITVKGTVAIAALVAGGTLEFTRISVGDGNIPAGQTAMTMTDLANRLFDVDINEVYSDSESQATVTGVFNNSQTQTGFYYRELGLFAKDPATGAEILYCYGNAGTEAEWISPAGEESVIEKEVHIVTLVGNATEVTATLKSGIYSTIEKTQGWLAVKADLDATAAEGGRVVASQMRFDPSQTLYVDAAATAEGADGSEAKPFKTIQAAVNAAYAGADLISIKIKPGTYSEDVATPTARGSAWIFERNGEGTATVKSLKIDIAPYARIQGLTFTPATGGIGIQLVSVPSAAIESNTINADSTGYGIYAARSGVRVNGNTINNALHAVFTSEASRVVAIGTAGTGNTNAFTADGSIIQCHGNNTITATTKYNTTNAGAINIDGGETSFPSSQGHLYSLGGFTETAALKTRLLQEFSKLKEGDFKGFQFWNNIVGNFGIFISSQTMHVWMHKTSNDEGGYGVAVFYAHRDAGAAYMHIVNGAFVDDTPKKFADSADLAKYLPLAGGIMSGQIKSNGGQNYPVLEHAQRGGSLWLFDKGDTTYKGGFILRAQTTDNEYHDLQGAADGRLFWNGKRIPISVNGIAAAADTGDVTIPVATATKYGLMKAATDEVVIDEDTEDAAITPAVYHDVSDFRHKNTAYKLGDKVECMFNFELFLECTQAGTTSANALDTRNVTHGQVITDGTVQWTVRTHIRSINGTFPDASGNVEAGAKEDDIKTIVLNTFFPVGSIYMDATGSINPNTQFGGTWVKIENAFLYGSGTKLVGATGGEENVTLTENQIPAHQHGVGTIEITGETGANIHTTYDGAFYKISDNSWCGSLEYPGVNVAFAASKSRTGDTAVTGGGSSHNNMPPYLVVNVWKRTA